MFIAIINLIAKSEGKSIVATTLATWKCEFLVIISNISNREPNVEAVYSVTQMIAKVTQPENHHLELLLI